MKTIVEIKLSRVFISLIILILPVLFLGSCSQDKGFWGFGTNLRNIRSYASTPIFSADDSIYWVYQFKTLPSPNLFGVKLERNELGWLPISTRTMKADREFSVLTNQYPPMKPGLYKLTLYHKQKVLDTTLFRLVPVNSGLY